jgi:hypothetical protein
VEGVWPFRFIAQPNEFDEKKWVRLFEGKDKYLHMQQKADRYSGGRLLAWRVGAGHWPSGVNGLNLTTHDVGISSNNCEAALGSLWIEIPIARRRGACGQGRGPSIGVSADMGAFELRGNPPEVKDEVGLIAIELVDDVAVAHQVKDGATEVLSFQSSPLFAATPSLTVRLVGEGVTLVTALHPRKRCGFQRGHPPQTPEQSRHDVNELFLDHSLGCVGRDELRPEGIILRRALSLEDKASRR